MEFLEILNDYQGFEEFEDFIEDIFIEYREKTLLKDRTEEVMKSVLRSTLSHFYCPPFKKHFLYKELNEASYWQMVDAMNAYKDFYDLKSIFEELFGTIEGHRITDDFPPEEPVIFNKASIPTYMILDSNGFYSEQNITQLFLGIDFSKVKRCICGNYFWVTRKDKISCSRICGNRVRQRKFLSDENKREEYRKRRLEYYHKNKEDINQRKKKKRRIK